MVKGGVEKLYAFFYQPGAVEKRCNGWNVYDPIKEFQRMGVGTDKCSGWRVSNINKDYSVRTTPSMCTAVSVDLIPSFLQHILRQLLFRRQSAILP